MKPGCRQRRVMHEHGGSGRLVGSSREESFVHVVVWAKKRKVRCAGGRFEVPTRRHGMWARAVKCDRVRIGMVKDHDPVCGAKGQVKEEEEG